MRLTQQARTQRQAGATVLIAQMRPHKLKRFHIIGHFFYVLWVVHGDQRFGIK